MRVFLEQVPGDPNRWTVKGFWGRRLGQIRVNITRVKVEVNPGSNASLDYHVDYQLEVD